MEYDRCFGNFTIAAKMVGHLITGGPLLFFVFFRKPSVVAGDPGRVQKIEVCRFLSHPVVPNMLTATTIPVEFGWSGEMMDTPECRFWDEGEFH